VPDVAVPQLFGRLRVLAAAVVMAATLGCGLMSLGGDSAPNNVCAEDGDCGRNAACDRVRGICVTTTRPDAGVFLRFSYPSSSSVEIHEFRSQRLDSTEPLVVDLPAPIAVEGWIGGGEPRRTVRADVTFSRPSGIGGSPAEETTAESSGSPAEFADWTRGVAYGARLIPWRAELEAYAAYVEPKDSDADLFPPVLVSGLEFVENRGAGGPVQPTRWEYDLPGPTQVRRLRGVITRSDGTPVPNVSVRAEDPVTARRVSTVATTAPYTTMAGGGPGDPATGSFELLLPASVRYLRLVVAPTEDEPNFPTTVWQNLDFDTLDVNADAALVFNEVAGDPAADQPPLAFPAVGLPVRLEGTVEGTETGTGAAVPVAGALLTFEREIPTGLEGVTATFFRIATTDGEGRIVPGGDNPDGSVGVALLEGDYAVTVTPPTGLRVAGMHTDFLRIAAPPGERVQRGQVFQLGPRAELHGTVLDLGHQPVGDLPIESKLVVPSGDGVGADPGALNRVINGYTDPDGAFELYVEPGTHLVLLAPLVESGFPWRIVSNVVAPNGPVDASLEAPVVLDGLVTIGGEATAGVEVEALVRSETFGVTIEVGSAQTDASGAFHLLLSPSLGTF
jgi:hypothetical protein